MSKLLGPLAPVLHWIVLGILNSYTSLNTWMVAALAGCALLYAKRDALLKARVEILIFLVYVALIALPWAHSHETLLKASIYLILISRAAWSLAAKSPFTIEYARSVTPAEYWNDIHFYRINFHISALWLATFICCLGATIWISAPLKSALVALFLITSSIFSSYYPSYYAKAKGL